MLTVSLLLLPVDNILGRRRETDIEVFFRAAPAAAEVRVQGTGMLIP